MMMTASQASDAESRDHWLSAENRWLKLANQTEILADLVGMGWPEELPAPATAQPR
jgi:hypothetical protein